jgi:cytosine/adenosine deaminase-related metal-dependent hydrolase
LTYRKFQADFLFTGFEMLNQDQVLITDEKGIIQEVVPKGDAGGDIQQLRGLLSPGFINSHCHLELSHMKGLIAERTGLVDFVFNIVTQRHFPEEEILEAISKAEDEMISNGIVAVGDICNNTLTIPRKLLERLHYYNFIEVSGWLPQIATQRFERSKANFDFFIESLLPVNSQVSLAPHAPYSVSDDLWKLIQPFFKGKTTTIHNQETDFEDALFLNGSGDFIRMYEMMKLDNNWFKPTGKSSLQSYLSQLQGAKNVLLVHNTFIKEEDILSVNISSQITGQQFFYCLCVNANTYIENKLPPVHLLRQHKCNITIGTDSLASNWSLSVLDEIKTIRQHFSFIPTIELLQWATINGARALQMDGRLGSFEKGKQPGIVLIETLNNGEIAVGSTAKLLL